MPELPEVETIKRDLSKLEKKKITDVNILYGAQFSPKEGEFVWELKGNIINSMSRHGKFLFMELSSGKHVLIHLKMSGQLIMATDSVEPHKHTRIYLDFEGGDRLLFNDMRRFGFMNIVTKEELDNYIGKYGPDAVNQPVTGVYLKQKAEKRKVSIKVFLLNQDIIAGIGNIYVDEVCFLSGIHPERSVADVTEEEWQRVAKNILPLLQKAIELRGTSFQMYKTGTGEDGNFVHHLQVFRRNGEDCYKCGEKIQKVKHSGRGTHFCVKCQK